MASVDGGGSMGLDLLQQGWLGKLPGEVNEVANLGAIGAAENLGNRAGAPPTYQLQRHKGVGQNLRGREGQGQAQGDQLAVGAAAGCGDVSQQRRVFVGADCRRSP